MIINGLVGNALLFCSVWFGVELLQTHQDYIEEEQSRLDESRAAMPAAWEIRLVQVGAGQGEQVYLLRKAVEAGQWLVTSGVHGICKIQIGDRSVVRTENQAKAGVAYTPYPIIGQLQRNALLAEAEVVYQAGTAEVRILTHVPVGMQMMLRRHAAVIAAVPAMSFRGVRWCTRRPSRMIAMVGTWWMTYEILQLYGIISWCQDKVLRTHGILVEVKEAIVGASAAAAEAWSVLAALYTMIAAVIPPWKLFLMSIIVYVLLGVITDAEEPGSATSSPGNSGNQTPATPEEGAESNALRTVSSAMVSQTAMMASLTERLHAMEKNANGGFFPHGDENGGPYLADPSGKSKPLTWALMDERFQAYAQIIKEDKNGGAVGQPSEAAGGSGPEDRFKNEKLPNDWVEGSESEGAKIKVPSKSKKPLTDGSAELAPLKEIPKGSTMDLLPSDYLSPGGGGEENHPIMSVIVKAMEDLIWVDEEIWALQFPENYRERIAPKVLMDLYRKGTTLKVFAKAWMKEKKLEGCEEARKIVVHSASLDVIFLVDKNAGAINLPTTERLARRLHGVMVGYQKVETESDWKDSGEKGWVSKVDTEGWAKIDPERVEQPTL